MQTKAHAELPARMAAARDMIAACGLCPRHCGVNRRQGERGYCRQGAEARCFREMIGFNEERALTPSHQVYFAGCNLTCGFCTVAEWNTAAEIAGEVNRAELPRIIRERRAQGARTLNLLGGEPTVSLPGILDLLAQLEAGFCVVWNTNLYFSAPAVELLAGIADIYLADLKCGNDRCAERLLGVKDYLPVVTRNLQAVRRAGEVIVRHLVLPGHYACCLVPALRWLASEMPDVKLSLRGNYVPPAGAGPAPAGYLEAVEFARAREFALALELKVIT